MPRSGVIRVPLHETRKRPVFNCPLRAGGASRTALVTCSCLIKIRENLKDGWVQRTEGPQEDEELGAGGAERRDVAQDSKLDFETGQRRLASSHRGAAFRGSRRSQ